jgi:hypothetical protein
MQRTSRIGTEIFHENIKNYLDSKNSNDLLIHIFLELARLRLSFDGVHHDFGMVTSISHHSNDIVRVSETAASENEVWLAERDFSLCRNERS